MDSIDSGKTTFDRACEAHSTHSALGLDLNQSSEMRAAHKKEAKKAEGVILELMDFEE